MPSKKEKEVSDRRREKLKELNEAAARNLGPVERLVQARLNQLLQERPIEIGDPERMKAIQWALKETESVRPALVEFLSQVIQPHHRLTAALLLCSEVIEESGGVQQHHEFLKASAPAVEAFQEALSEQPLNVASQVLIAHLFITVALTVIHGMEERLPGVTSGTISTADLMAAVSEPAAPVSFGHAG